ncbi:hypothetical protein LTS18_005766 [Coniosporium uncinatum]|uniref:Uncharacterized protein n=1 Tax=Coniosporium uncinatum TaxID=93489 RepID=A0ACC3D4K1_9PEZI|nr:hypothetical protein LTS18_005766 [Coniosporium uncinatum]
MGNRVSAINTSILRAIFHEPSTAPKRSLLAKILTFFSFLQLALARFKVSLFGELREQVWGLDEGEYNESFGGKEGQQRKEHGKGEGLKPIGDLGYSGSTFFTTPNSAYLIKSIPRSFEHTFFSQDLLPLYDQHMHAHPSSLLVRITDFLYTPHKTLGGLTGLAPTTHIIMENILYGKESDTSGPDGEGGKAWETYDLKPASYFYPERDIADGALAPESVKERLVDVLPDKIRISKHDRDELLDHLSQDTKLLQECNAVDYSLFLVRYPASHHSSVTAVTSKATTAWRTGVKSVDGKWVYRAVILDFFWAKHKGQPMFMTGLVSGFNVFAGKGHMSITTDAGEYRGRFLRMVEEYLSVDPFEDQEEEE